MKKRIEDILQTYEFTMGNKDDVTLNTLRLGAGQFIKAFNIYLTLLDHNVEAVDQGAVVEDLMKTVYKTPQLLKYSLEDGDFVGRFVKNTDTYFKFHCIEPKWYY